MGAIFSQGRLIMVFVRLFWLEEVLQDVSLHEWFWFSWPRLFHSRGPQELQRSL